MKSRLMLYIHILLLTLMIVPIEGLRAQSDYDPDSPPEPGLYSVVLTSNPYGCARFEQTNNNGLYEKGADIKIKVYPSEDYEFINWEMNGKIISTNTEYSLTVNSNIRLIANLRYNPQNNPMEPGSGYYNLITESYPSDGGMIEQNAHGLYKPGEIVKLQAHSYPDYDFDHWKKDGDIVSSEIEYSFAMPEKRVHIKAIFKWNPSDPDEPGVSGCILYLKSNNINAGTISQSGTGVYPAGTIVTLVASPFAGYKFAGWYKDNVLLSENTTYKIEIRQSQTTIEARFEAKSDGGDGEDSEDDDKIEIGVDDSSGDEEKGSVEIIGAPLPGQEITVKAIPSEGYAFEGWYLNGEFIKEAEMEYELLLDNSMESLVAKFVEQPFSLKQNGGIQGNAYVARLRNNIATLVAKAIEGFTFDGWYLGEDLLSKSMTYDFNISNLKSLPEIIAKYSEGPTSNIKIEKSEFSVNAFIKNGKLHLNSKDNIKDLAIYSFSGNLLYYRQNINPLEDISLDLKSISVIIICHNKLGETKVLKIK